MLATLALLLAYPLTSPREGEVGEALRAGWGVGSSDLPSTLPPTRRPQSGPATSPSRGEVKNPATFSYLSLTSCDDKDVTVSDAKAEDGVLVHEVKSPYQAGTTTIRVLLPDAIEKGKKYPVVYLLPVEAGRENRYGDGMKEAKKLDLHNKLKAIFVAPTFSHLPWYADHPTKTDVRQESYFLKVVVPFVEKTYPAKADAGGRLLLGFSKSGWGAYTLLLRHPDTFGKAAAWDAPLMMEKHGQYGSGDIFATAENFADYRVTKLLEDNAAKFGKEPRLILTGYGSFRDHHKRAHELMDKLKIAHEYRDGPSLKHDWHSGWVKEAAELLLVQPKDKP